MKKHSSLVLLIFGLLTLGNCKNSECKSTNTIFNNFSPARNEYKDELIRQLSIVDKSKLSYWMEAYWTESYKTDSATEYIRVHIKGDGLCADLILAIKDSRKGIEGVLKNKMLGYKGAELEDLQYEIYQNSSKTEFVFKEVSGIRD